MERVADDRHDFADPVMAEEALDTGSVGDAANVVVPHDDSSEVDALPRRCWWWIGRWLARLSDRPLERYERTASSRNSFRSESFARGGPATAIRYVSTRPGEHQNEGEADGHKPIEVSTSYFVGPSRTFGHRPASPKPVRREVL